MSLSPNNGATRGDRVEKATVHLKTNPDTTFYKVSDEQAGTDPLVKKRTWKPRRRKVRSSYRVPAEHDDTVPDWAAWQENFANKAEHAAMAIQANLIAQEAWEAEYGISSSAEEEYYYEQRQKQDLSGMFRENRVPRGGRGGGEDLEEQYYDETGAPLPQRRAAPQNNQNRGRGDGRGPSVSRERGQGPPRRAESRGYEDRRAASRERSSRGGGGHHQSLVGGGQEEMSNNAGPGGSPTTRGSRGGPREAGGGSQASGSRHGRNGQHHAGHQSQLHHDDHGGGDRGSARGSRERGEHRSGGGGGGDRRGGEQGRGGDGRGPGGPQGRGGGPPPPMGSPGQGYLQPGGGPRGGGPGASPSNFNTRGGGRNGPGFDALSPGGVGGRAGGGQYHGSPQRGGGGGFPDKPGGYTKPSYGGGPQQSQSPPQKKSLFDTGNKNDRSVSPGQKASYAPPKDPEERKEWEAEKAYQGRRKAIIDHPEMAKARADFMQMVLYSDQGDMAEVQQRFEEFTDFLTRQAFDRWEVQEGQKAMATQKNLRTQMLKAQQGYLQELQYHRYREGSRPGDIPGTAMIMPDKNDGIHGFPDDPSVGTKADVVKKFVDGDTSGLSANDGARVILYDALTVFTEDEQELIRMIIDERVHQLLMYQPGARGRKGTEEDDDSVSRDELNFVKNELISWQLKAKTLEDEYGKKVQQFQDLVDELRAKVERLETVDVPERDTRIDELTEENEMMQMKVEEIRNEFEAEKFELEGSVAAKQIMTGPAAGPTIQMEIDLLQKQLEELRNGGAGGKDVVSEGVGAMTEEERMKSEAEMASMKEEVLKLQAKLSEAEGEINRLRAELLSGATNAARKNSGDQADDDATAKLRSELAEARLEIEKLKALLGEQRELLEAAERDAKRYKKNAEEAEQQVARLQKKLKLAEDEALELKRRVVQLELVEQELLNQLADINELKDAGETGKAFKGMMRKLGVSKGDSKLMRKVFMTGPAAGPTIVFDRLYQDALERMERTALAHQEKYNKQKSYWEGVLGARDLYGSNFLPVGRPPASNHLMDAFRAMPDRSLVAALPSDDYVYMFSQPLTHGRPRHLEQYYSGAYQHSTPGGVYGAEAMDTGFNEMHRELLMTQHSSASSSRGGGNYGDSGSGRQRQVGGYVTATSRSALHHAVTGRRARSLSPTAIALAGGGPFSPQPHFGPEWAAVGAQMTQHDGVNYLRAKRQIVEATDDIAPPAKHHLSDSSSSVSGTVPSTVTGGMGGGGGGGTSTEYRSTTTNIGAGGANLTNTVLNMGTIDEKSTTVTGGGGVGAAQSQGRHVGKLSRHSSGSPLPPARAGGYGMTTSVSLGGGGNGNGKAKTATAHKHYNTVQNPTHQHPQVKVGSPRAHQNAMIGDRNMLSPRTNAGFERSPRQGPRPMSPTGRFYTTTGSGSSSIYSASRSYSVQEVVGGSTFMGGGSGVVNMTKLANAGDSNYIAKQVAASKQGLGKVRCQHCGHKLTH